MLRGSSAEKCDLRIETVVETDKGELVEKKSYCYDIDVPDSGVSAFMCFCFSNNGIRSINLGGPPEKDGEQTSYTKILRPNDYANDRWAESGDMTMRTDWYETHAKTEQYNIATLTVINTSFQDLGRLEESESQRLQAVE